MASTTTGLTGLMSTFYDRVFLDRAKASLVHDFGAQRKKLPKHEGKTVTWNRMAPLAPATTPLTEGVTNPAPVDVTTAQVTATINAYGNYIQVTDLFSLTSIDVNLKEHTEVMGQNAGETLDILTRNELVSGATVQLANNRGALNAVTAADSFNGAEIRKAVRTLKQNKAMRFAGNVFRGIAQPFTAYDLFGNAEWLDAHRYTDAKDIEDGVIGRLHGVEFKETNQGFSEVSTVTVYSNLIFGMNAYGTVELEGQPGPKMYVKVPRQDDGNTSNPLNIFSTVGWKAFFATKVLNPSWVINVKAGATA